MITPHRSLSAAPLPGPRPSTGLGLGLRSWDESDTGPVSDFMLTRVYAVGMPAERRARIAARRAFVRLKQRAVDAIATVPGSLGELLRRKVRQTNDMGELAELREVILALMPDESGPDRTARLVLQREFERAFGDSSLPPYESDLPAAEPGGS
ncbi:MAG: hypothetical protein MUC74_07780 [Ideonella sp.]|jgi:hypothetical protein|nr:hypothetical protein [Ideonella sp.]